MDLKHWLQIWKLSNKYGFSKIGFFRFIMGYLFSKNYHIVFNIDKKKEVVTGFNFIEHNRIKRLVVSEQYRGKGIGKQLIPDFCKLVYTDNKRNAVGFYEKFGFKVVGKKNKDVFILKR